MILRKRGMPVSQPDPVSGVGVMRSISWGRPSEEEAKNASREMVIFVEILSFFKMDKTTGTNIILFPIKKASPNYKSRRKSSINCITKTLWNVTTCMYNHSVRK